MSSDAPRVVILGAGAVGGTVAAWIAEHHDNIAVLDQGPVAEALRERGITTYQQGAREQAVTVQPQVLDSIEDARDADILVIAVKNYSLDAVCRVANEAVGDGPIVVGLQNGIDNQHILPKYFSRVVYGVIGYNAWLEEPGLIGYHNKGPLIMGTPDNTQPDAVQTVADLFQRGVDTVVTGHFQDAAHSKLIINLTNSLTTLVGHRVRPIERIDLLQRILSNLLYEGVRVVKAAGYNECKIGGMPPWFLIAASARLPQCLTRPLFKKNLDKMVLSSMAQDVLQRGRTDTELESINGYILSLAHKHRVPAPYNRAVYSLCRDAFASPHFQPMEVEAVWDKVQDETTSPKR